MANTSGVFSLEELVALGQTGDARKDWLKGGPGRAALNPKLKFPAGYYRIPGQENQALYVDPTSGSVPQQFMDMLDPQTGDLKRDPISGLPSSFLPDFNTWKPPAYVAGNMAGLDEQRALEAQGLTPQQAQDRRFGGRPIVGASDTYKPGVHNSIGTSAGAYDRFKGLGGTNEMLGFSPVDESGDFADLYRKRNTTLGDALAANFMQRYGAQTGLKGLNQIQAGDPREMERLRSTYESLDPAKRSSWLFYQDPGNLTPELREARLEARRGERELIQGANQYANEYRYLQQPSGGRSYQFVIKRGDVSQTEAGTGREKFYGNVPLRAEAVKGKYDRFGDFGKRIGGGLAGGFLGFFGSGGSLWGAATGAYQGAGGPQPKGGVAGALWGAGMGASMGWAGAGLGAYQGAGGVKGLKQGGFNSWQGSGGQIPGAREIGSAIAFAKFNGRKPGSHPAGLTGRPV